MSITQEEVKHIALLSRLDLSSEEVESYTGELDQILHYAEKLKALDVSGIEPLSHAVPQFNVDQDDEIQPSLPPQEALANAPDQEDQCFRVPRVTE